MYFFAFFMNKDNTNNIHNDTQEHILTEDQRFLSTLISNLPGYVYLCEEKNGLWFTQFLSHGIVELTGFNADEFIKKGGMSYNQIVHPEDIASVQQNVREALLQKKPYQINYRIVTKSGKLKWVWEQGRGIYNDAGKITATEGFITDITEKKKFEESLIVRNNELATLNIIGQELNKLTDENKILELIFESANKIFDTKNIYISLYNQKENTIEFPLYMVEGKRHNAHRRKYSNGWTEFIIKTKQPCLIANNIPQKFCELGIEQMGILSKCIMSSPLLNSDEVIGVLTLQDYNNENSFDETDLNILNTITSQASIALGNSRLYASLQNELEENKKAEQRITESLRSKEVLLQEVHHRVKNNLQIMSSLMKLQTRFIDDERMKEIFKESENRIKSMAIVHTKLYSTKNYGRIDFKDYLVSLIENFQASYLGSKTAIRFELIMENIEVNIDTAIPCGLIINELVSNAIKYAFVKRSAGTISITMKKNPDGVYYLEVNDDGVGVSDKSLLNSERTLGIQLVKLLTSQLNGKLSYESEINKGVRFEIIFEESVYKERN